MDTISLVPPRIPAGKSGPLPNILVTPVDILDNTSKVEEMPGRTPYSDDQPITAHEFRAEILKLAVMSQQTVEAVKAIQEREQGKERTALPNWALVLIFTMLMGLVGLVWQNLQGQIGDLKHQESVNETWMRNTREQMIAHGWRVDLDGNIVPPQEKSNAK